MIKAYIKIKLIIIKNNYIKNNYTLKKDARILN